ncbi:leucine efflux protein LeuE [uncultured Rhodoferax sp.]|uniref:leucine efflux protein LeuE n=1 Tax=uncultured Rhodoferax sp. TaxID=223188 RepID=UPI0025EC5961|nr:leucine efflux protein LeuE [uncultured Rhodoferax sp.]
MSFYGVTDLWTYVIGAIGIILLPGPNSLYVLSVATVRGVKAGYQGACGVFVGDTILLLLTALGAASLLRSYPALFMVVKYAGAAYLTWVGLNLLIAAFKKWRSADVADLSAQTAVAEAAANMQQPFKRALVISLLNPKAILFLLSFFVQFIDPNYDTPAIPFLILGSIIMVFSALYLSALIFAGARLAQGFGRRKRLSASLSSAVGGLFMWFGAKLATASLN